MRDDKKIECCTQPDRRLPLRSRRDKTLCLASTSYKRAHESHRLWVVLWLGFTTPYAEGQVPPQIRDADRSTPFMTRRPVYVCQRAMELCQNPIPASPVRSRNTCRKRPI